MKKIGLGIIQFIIFFVLFIITWTLAKFSYFVSILSILIIFLYGFQSYKDGKIFNFTAIKNRILSVTKESTRLWVVIFFMFIFGAAFLSIRSQEIEKQENKIKNQKEQEFQKAYNNAPDIKITINSSTGYIGELTGYILKVNIIGSEEIYINDNLQNKKKGDIEQTIELYKPKTTIIIEAKNKYKSNKKEITITRDLTEKELEEQKLEKERLEEENKKRIEEERKTTLTLLDGYLNELSQGYKINTIEDTGIITRKFHSIYSSILPYLSDEDKIIKNKAIQVRNKLIQTQKIYFPKLRKKFCEVTSNKVWEYDVDVYCPGDRIEFVGGLYAARKNCMSSYEPIAEALQNLRFSQVRYYWYKGSDYTYWNMKKISDRELQ